MDIADVAAKAVKKISSGRGKKLAKKGYPEELPKVQPVDGEQIVYGVTNHYSI